jgi:hypothetical protein
MIPPLKELCINKLSEELKTEIFLRRDVFIGLYWKLIEIEFFRTLMETIRDAVDENLLRNLKEDTLDIIFSKREEHPALYCLVVEQIFWDTFFM